MLHNFFFTLYGRKETRKKECLSFQSEEIPSNNQSFQDSEIKYYYIYMNVQIF